MCRMLNKNRMCARARVRVVRVCVGGIGTCVNMHFEIIVYTYLFRSEHVNAQLWQ